MKVSASLTGKTRSFDHPSPEYDKLFKHQIIRPFALSIRIGPKWSRGPFFPLGCRDYNVHQQYRDKKLLILEEEKYSTQKALSDLSFADCKCHRGDAEELVYEVRNWFIEIGQKNVPSASSIWDSYNVFYADMYEEKTSQGFKQKDINRLPIVEFMNFIDEKIS
jgi:hypothetical protein